MRLKLVLVAILLMATLAAADEIRVATAADLNYAFRDIAARFEKETGHKVDLIIGSLGNLYSQIQNGAPFDLFFWLRARICNPRRFDEGFGFWELWLHSRG